ncbi:MAG: energy transducer TonB [Pseudomonadota bacterium]
MNDRSREKKSETLEVRMPHSKKQAFMAACERQGITASEAVRTFVDEYLKRSRRAKLKTIAKDMTMKLLDNPLKTTGSMTVLVFAALAVSAAPSAAEDDRDAQPIRPPMVVYPEDMISAGHSADCEAVFDVTEDGLPVDIVVTCSHDGFLETTEKAVSTLEFEPKIVDGLRARREGVLYPIIYELNPEVEE